MRRAARPLATLAVIALGACASTAQDDASSSADAISRRQYTQCRKYTKLSQTGLFEIEDGRLTDRVAAGVIAFEPAYGLWSDGAAKRRWIRLPEGAAIDTRDMDHWRFPKGTKLWKEFVRDGTRVETRLVEIGCDADPARPERGSGDFFFGAFVWGEDGDATFTPLGEQDARGTAHDVPSQDACVRCHAGEPGAVLGFSALQLSPSRLPLTLAALQARGVLSHAPDPAGYLVPGDDVTRDALGYLHGNCGHCHSAGGRAYDVVHQLLRLDVADTRVAARETAVFRSIVDQPVQVRLDEARGTRVKSGAPDESFLYFRMVDPSLRMPPGTETPDPEGTARVRRWIESLGRRDP